MSRGGPELVSRPAKEFEAGKCDDAEGPHGLARVKESDERAEGTLGLCGGCGTSKESEWDTPQACSRIVATQRERGRHR